MRIGLLCLILMMSYRLSAQIPDSLTRAISQPPKSKEVWQPNPRKSFLMSAIMPGAGQIYNRQYYKAPIAIGLVASMAYLHLSSASKYRQARNSYVSLLDTDPTNDISYLGSTDLAYVTSQKNVERSNRDLFLILGVVSYGLQLVDAFVSAHLMGFDIDDQLSIRATPHILPASSAHIYGGALDITWTIK